MRERILKRATSYPTNLSGLRLIPLFPRQKIIVVENVLPHDLDYDLVPADDRLGLPRSQPNIRRNLHLHDGILI